MIKILPILILLLILRNTLYSQEKMKFDTINLDYSLKDNFIRALIMDNSKNANSELYDENLKPISFRDLLEKNKVIDTLVKDVITLYKDSTLLFIESNRISSDKIVMILKTKDKYGVGFEIYKSDGNYEKIKVLYWVSFDNTVVIDY
ncbi:MAG: hypothetical protein H6578_02725 [Chitinophagales bacterium]|nr:hypothetical protein [Chitinophagales bacterium]